MKSEKYWDHQVVAMETFVVLASRKSRNIQIMNALIYCGGIMEQLTNKLINIMDVESYDYLETDHFERFFTAFSVQTQVTLRQIPYNLYLSSSLTIN